MGEVVGVFPPKPHTLHGLPILVLLEICTHNDYWTNKRLMRVSRVFFILLTSEKMDYIMFRKTIRRIDKYIHADIPKEVHPIFRVLKFKGYTTFEEITVRVGTRVTPLRQLGRVAFELAVSPASTTLRLVNDEYLPYKSHTVFGRKRGIRVIDVVRWLCACEKRDELRFGQFYTGFNYVLDGFHIKLRSKRPRVVLCAQWSHYFSASALAARLSHGPHIEHVPVDNDAVPVAAVAAAADPVITPIDLQEQQ